MLCRVPLVCKCVRDSVFVCVYVCSLAGSGPSKICQSVRAPSTSVGWDNEVDTGSPAASACLAVSLTDDTDSFAPSGSGAVYHSLAPFFASNGSSTAASTTSEPWIPSQQSEPQVSAAARRVPRSSSAPSLLISGRRHGIYCSSENVVERTTDLIMLMI